VSKNVNHPNKELLILRHGKSDWDSNQSDFFRPLKNRGKRGAQRMGAWLADQELIPDSIISSPAERALNTAEKTCKSMGLDARIVLKDQRIYEADLSNLLQLLSELPEKTQRVLLVGHNPGLEELLCYLAAGIKTADDGKLLTTAALAHLSLTTSWRSLSKHSASLCSLIRAKSLPKRFPFATKNGIEMRVRPAYYYSQSSIIPYRFEDNKLQIMLVSSSSDKHWVVPKGIIDPGLTALQSAEKESLEEAGITSGSNKISLGFYHCEKWEAQCHVEVFAMQVDHVLSELQWQESHRRRRWVSIDEAIEQINQQALIPLIKKLKDKL